MSRVFAWLCGLAILGVLVSCSGSAPEILFPDTRLALVRDPSTGAVAEVLRFYVALRDADGADDPARVFVVHDDSELFWELVRESWISFEYAGDQWYGVPEIRMPDGEDLPRGEYRLIVEDAALARAESTFFLGAEPASREEPFPRLTVEARRLTVEADGPVVLRVYGRAGQMIVSSVVAPGPVPEEIEARIPEESGLTAYVSTAGEEPIRESGPIPLEF
ncbi:MAG: hypothetical protein ACOCW3_00105 [Spirochaetota bacterium]